MASKSFILRIRESDKYIFEAIKKSKKKVETRAATPKYRVMETGDELVFVCGGKKLKKFVRAVHIFKTTKGLIKKYKIKDINPAFKTEKEMKEMWLGFPGYAEKIKKYGLIAAELK